MEHVLIGVVRVEKVGVQAHMLQEHILMRILLIIVMYARDVVELLVQNMFMHHITHQEVVIIIIIVELVNILMVVLYHIRWDGKKHQLSMVGHVAHVDILQVQELIHLQRIQDIRNVIFVDIQQEHR